MTTRRPYTKEEDQELEETVRNLAKKQLRDPRILARRSCRIFNAFGTPVSRKKKVRRG